MTVPILLANAGTPLMWASFLHLAFGNAIIGLGEGLLLAVVFKAPKRKSIGLLILANYFSAWVGGVWASGVFLNSRPLDLYNAWPLLWATVAFTYVLTLILEWPFVAACFRGTKDWLRRSILASLLVQTISYSLLFGWYWLASGTSLYTWMNIVPASDIALPDNMLLYSISPEDGSVRVRTLANPTERVVGGLKFANPEDCLSVRQSPAIANMWDLVAVTPKGEGREKDVVVVLKSFASSVAMDRTQTPATTPNLDHPWHNFGTVMRLSDANSPWSFRTGFWAIEGLRGENSQTGERLGFSLETPFLRWRILNATQLPSDQVVFQLGTNQICVLEPQTRKIAMIAHGRCPVVVSAESQPLDIK